MIRRRSLGLVCSIALALVAYGARGRSQDPASAPRTFLMDLAPPAIERGINPVQMHVPGSPEVVRTEAIRSLTKPDRLGASGARYMPGRVIVKFREGASSSSRIASLSAASRASSLSQRPTYADFDLATIEPGEDPEAVARTLRQQPEVEYAQAAYRVRADMVPNDPYYTSIPQWNMPMIDLERAWDIQPAAGSSITVAVLDTGVAYTNATVKFHANAWTDDQGVPYPALGDLTLSFVAATELASGGRFVSPADFIWDDNLPIDLHGHGTHVSGTIGQLTNNHVGTAGVAFNVKLMPVKVIDEMWDDIFGSPHAGTDDVVARGIRYAADNGAKILNMSIGRTGPPNCGINPDQVGCAPVVEAAIRYAVGKGCFLAISSGNTFEDGNPTSVIAEIASRVQGAVSVAAVDRSKSHAWYSTTGPWVELAAPGGSFRGFPNSGGILQQTLDLDLVDTWKLPPSTYAATPPRFDALAYFFFTGTSQAAPHVSGVAAMLMQQGITDPAAIEAVLEKTATDLGDPGRDSTFGYGLVEARSALRGLGLAR